MHNQWLFVFLVRGLRCVPRVAHSVLHSMAYERGSYGLYRQTKRWVREPGMLLFHDGYECNFACKTQAQMDAWLDANDEAIDFGIQFGTPIQSDTTFLLEYKSESTVHGFEAGFFEDSVAHDDDEYPDEYRIDEKPVSLEEFYSGIKALFT
jgi:hypothetical protein